MNQSMQMEGGEDDQLEENSKSKDPVIIPESN